MSDLPAPLRDALAARYVLEREVGRGGMATVYRARDVKHGRPVAVKVLRSDLAQSVGVERFLKEIDIAARLTHPHILPLFDSGKAPAATGGEVFLYYVMPFVEGESLRAALNRMRLMDVDGTRAIVRRVADALDYAHRLGVVHRDIKPENILLPEGQAVVADFGIAKALVSASTQALTRTGIAVGTPGYMSPEQAAGVTDLDGRTDVYSLGAVAYEMLVGDLPRIWLTNEAQAAGRFLDASEQHRTILDRLPRGTERALVRALSLRTEDRFPTPGELALSLEHPEDLERNARTTATGTPPASPARPSRPAASVERRAEPIPVATSGFLGAPTIITAERVVDGEVPESEFPALLDEIRASFEREGYDNVSGRSLVWTARRPRRPLNPFEMLDQVNALRGQVKGLGGRGKLVVGIKRLNMLGGDYGAPRASVSVVSRNGRTRITVEKNLAEEAGGLFGGLLGGLGVAGTAVGLVLAVNVGHLPGVFVALLGGVIPTATYWLTRSIYGATVAHRTAAIERLADRLADHCEAAVSPTRD